MAQPPHTGGERRHFTGFTGSWIYPQAGGTRPKKERVTTIGLYNIGKSHDSGIQQEPPSIPGRLLLQPLHRLYEV